MSLYYQDEFVTLYHGNCLTDHREWLDADVLVTDPPYGMSYVTRASKTAPSKPIAGDDSPDTRDRALELWGEKPALVFGTWRVPRPAETKQVIIWDKGDSPGMGDLNIPWGPSHEEIYVLGSRGWTGKRGGAVIRSNTMSAGDRDRPNHPTPKPVSLMELLLHHVPVDSLLADPFAGAGATLIAARNLRRRCVGVELEEKHCKTAARRLSQGVLDVFGGL